MEAERQTFLVRPAVSSDALGILETLRTAFEDYRSSYTPGAFGDTVLTPDSIGQRLSDMCVFVTTTCTGQIVGTIGCNFIDREEGHIRGMAVRPLWQGSGLAMQLLESVESVLRDGKCMQISLDTTEPLTRAMRFYEKNGYHRSGKISDFFGMRLFEYIKVLKAR